MIKTTIGICRMLKFARKIAPKSKNIYIAILIFPLLTGCMFDIRTQGALITEKNAQPHPFTNGSLYAIKEKKEGGFESGKAMTFKTLGESGHDYELTLFKKDGSVDDRISPVRFLNLSNSFYLVGLSKLPDHWMYLILHYEDGGVGLIDEKAGDENLDFTKFLMNNAKELAQLTEGEDKYLIIKKREKVLEQIKLFLQANQALLKYTDEAFDKKGMERFMAKNKP